MSRTVLFDLDGTLTDPAPGIIGSFRKALVDLGHEPPPFEELGWIIGPALRLSFPKVMGEGSDAEAAVERYRVHYRAGGMYDLTLYDGMMEAVTAIGAASDRMFVCTAKPEPYAVPIVERFGYAPHFERVYGAALDGSLDDKADIIAKIIAEQGIDPARTVMIGDRMHDIHAAQRHGIASVGVAWGYGGVEELAQAGATVICERPMDLPAVVAGMAI
ncbi:MAG: HAD hydrolase-like protein [Phreatobacter sp.]|nr:HAD hydrolase-like protein [Phreatobacter sp.]